MFVYRIADTVENILTAVQLDVAMTNGHLLYGHKRTMLLESFTKRLMKFIVDKKVIFAIAFTDVQQLWKNDFKSSS